MKSQPGVIFLPVFFLLIIQGKDQIQLLKGIVSETCKNGNAGFTTVSLKAFFLAVKKHDKFIGKRINTIKVLID